MTTKIPVGTPYFQDHGFGRWPEEWADVEFSITHSGDSLKLVAPGFGELSGDYGNGAIWVREADWLRAHPMTTAPKLPEGLEPVAWLTTWPKDRCRGAGSFLQRHDPQPRYDCNHYEPLYTATQMREAILAATERAAKVAEAEAVEETGDGNDEARAAASTGRGEGGEGA